MQTRPEKTEIFNHGGPPEGISVIMVSYWTGPVLSAAIESVLAPNQDGAVELIVVDNGNPPAVSGELVRLAEGGTTADARQWSWQRRVRTRL